MKLPIKKEYYDKIKSGEKQIEFRDAHITFVCEETGETLTKYVIGSSVIKNHLHIPGVLEDDYVIEFWLGEKDDQH